MSPSIVRQVIEFSRIRRDPGVALVVLALMPFKKVLTGGKVSKAIQEFVYTLY